MWRAEIYNMDCLDSCHAFQNETWCFPLQPYHIVCNAVLNRLESAAKAEGSRGATAIRQLRADLAADVQKLPLDDRIGARATSDSQLDLNQSKLFMTDHSKRQRLLQVVADPFNPVTVHYRGRTVLRQVPLSVLLSSLHYAWTVWSLRTVVSPDTLSRYQQAMSAFCEAWTALAWEHTPWVHWMACHSTAYLSVYETMYVFSSIPTEYRHKGFKLDISHSCMAWKLTRPTYTQRSLAHVIRMHALDLILLQDNLVKTRRKRQFQK